MKYQKINTLFKRDENNLIIPSEYCQEEFKYLKDLKWECTEKIDGTNMRVIIKPKYETEYLQNVDKYIDKFNGFDIEIKGKADNAQIPKHLLSKMQKIFTSGRIYEVFAEHYILNDNNFEKNLSTIILYGEGYGAKIQNGGNYISNDVDFILFDIKVGDMWLLRPSCEEIAKSLNIKIVPFIGLMTIPEAIEYVKKGFVSNISENRNYMAEGLVLKTPLGLIDRKGNRLITKIKYKDFLDLNRKTPKVYEIYKRVNSFDCWGKLERDDTKLIGHSYTDKKVAKSVLQKIRMENTDTDCIFFIVEKSVNSNEILNEIYE